MIAHAPSSDSELIASVRGGDINAYGELVERHAPRVRACIALRAPLPEVIDELSHEAFVFAYRNLERFEEGTSFSAWVCAIVLQLLRAEQQRFRRNEVRQARYLDHVIVEQSLLSERETEAPAIEWLDLCLHRLTPRMRELVELKYSAALSAEEIAGKISQSVAWVRTTLFRVRQQLRQCIESAATS